MATAFPAPNRAIPVSALGVDRRATFITRTYAHLAMAVGLFVALEVAYFTSGVAETIYDAVAGVSWLLVLGAFMVVSWLASRAAHNVESVQAQYLGLVAAVGAWSIIFVPLLTVANQRADGTTESAAIITILGFGGLTAIAFVTRRDFSFLSRYLMWGGVVALCLIVGSLLFGFSLGIVFSVAMVAFAGAAILHDTSNVIHHFPEDRYVGAALELFASVALLFWYVLSIFIGRD